ncbi:MAG: hypothetical protein IJ193_09780 [Bacilli bacterium]|nr:hypothetical protein [Bacilli bacterium]
MNKDEKKQNAFYELRDKYAREFSELVIQRLGLEPEGDNNTLVFSDIFLSGIPLHLIYEGYKFVPFDYEYIAEQNPDTIKVFDPYNDLGLINYCLSQYMVYIQEIDVNKYVSIISISNNKMNEYGHGEIAFDTEYGTSELSNTPDGYHIIGHDYNRDSLKYLDLIYIMDGAAKIEYTALRNLDLVNMDKFEI